MFLPLSLARLLRGINSRRLLIWLSNTAGNVFIFDSILTDPLTRLTVAEVDLLVTELLLAAETADRQVVAGELSMTGEGGVTVQTPGTD